MSIVINALGESKVMPNTEYVYYLVCRAGDFSLKPKVFQLKTMTMVRDSLRRQGKSKKYCYDTYMLIGVKMGAKGMYEFIPLEIDWSDLIRKDRENAKH